MELFITRSRIEHVLKVAIWKELAEHNRIPYYLPWMFMFLCGTNVLCSADTMEELKEKMKEFEDWKLLPRIIYIPPQRKRWQWFDKDFKMDPESSGLEYEASVTCVGPVGENINGVETYEFSPWEIAFTKKKDLVEGFYTFCLCRRRIRINAIFVIPNDILKMIWRFLRKTTNKGFVL